jgi:hypothetical protein
MTFNELEQENVKLRASLVEANRFSTDLATKLAMAGQHIGFSVEATPAEIMAQCRLRLLAIAVTPQRNVVLLDRACTLIMGEWGYTRDRALAWLNDDTQDWTPRPQSTEPSPPGTFIQVTRTTKVTPP